MNTNTAEIQIEAPTAQSTVRMIIEHVCVGEEFALLRKVLERYCEEDENA